MCTIILVHQPWLGTSLWVGANRDERLSRPSAPPELRRFGEMPVLAPLDLQAGGTWMGLNAAGLFVGITNRYPTNGGVVSARVLAPQRMGRQRVERLPAAARPPSHGCRSLPLAPKRRGRPPYRWPPPEQRRPDAGRRSRGGLVVEALQYGGAEEGANAAVRVSPDTYNPFHLLLADRRGAFESTCVHMPDRENDGGQGGRGKEPTLPPYPPAAYGTRSSTVLALGEAPEAVRYEHAEGPPCRTEYQDLSPLARRLLGGGSF